VLRGSQGAYGCVGVGKQSKRVLAGKGVCRYVCFVCVWPGKFPVCHAWDCDVSGVGKNDQGCVNMGADGYRRVSKHAGIITFVTQSWV